MLIVTGSQGDNTCSYVWVESWPIAAICGARRQLDPLGSQLRPEHMRPRMQPPAGIFIPANVINCCLAMEELEIISATDEERDWAAELLARSGPWITLQVTLDQCRQACRDPEYLLYVARRRGELCGAVVLDRRGVAGSPYIKSIAVAEKMRSCGIGASLMEFAENHFRPEAQHIFLCVSSFNPRARAFYERLGYRAVGEFNDYIIAGASEILMHKRLR